MPYAELRQVVVYLGASDGRMEVVVRRNGKFRMVGLKCVRSATAEGDCEVPSRWAEIVDGELRFQDGEARKGKVPW